MKQTAAVLFLILTLVSCAGKTPAPIASPATHWKPAPQDIPQLKISAATVSPELQNRKDWTLPALIDLALNTNNQTRITWFQSKAAAADFESKKGPFYPTVDLAADLSKNHGSAVGGRFSFDQKSSSPGVAIAYVLYDFGKRTADAEEARQALLSANWTHNAAIQRVILEVQQAYYQFVNAKALLKAEQQAVELAKTNVEAAQERHQAGVATIADELQAKTALAQAQLSVDDTTGTIQVLRGVLAVLIGVPASGADLDVVEAIPERPPLDQMDIAIEALIKQAMHARPELQAARSDVLQEQAKADSKHAERFPSLQAGGTASRLYYFDPSNSSNNYGASISIRFPLFDGFTRKYEEMKERELTEAARSQVAQLQQAVGLQVWTNYYILKTAAEKINTAEAFLDNAQQSYDVAQGRYREGVGSILDLLAAQNALLNANAQNVQARTDWYLALARLSHATGTLGLDETPAK
jgi:outer membrane protein TolC